MELPGSGTHWVLLSIPWGLHCLGLGEPQHGTGTREPCSPCSQPAVGMIRHCSAWGEGE